MNLKEAIQVAEENARQRELSSESFINLEEVEEQERKANEQGYGLYKIKPANKAGFLQIIKENTESLVKSKYLSSAEMGFLFSLSPLIEMHSNAITDGSGGALSVSDIAKYLDRDLSGTSRMVNGLLDKGILFEVNHSSKKVSRTTTKRTLCVNPEIIYCGDRNKINATLCRIVIQQDVLERKKIHLDWKIWLKSGHENGALYKRKTYMQLKKQSKN